MFFEMSGPIHLQRLKNPRSPDVSLPLSHEVFITLTTYTRNTWYPYAFSRDSQHVLPSLNTLGDVWNCIPCALKSDGSMPKEISEIDIQHDLFGHSAGSSKERVLSFNLGDSESDQDSVVMVVEGTAYSDGRGKPDYAE
jgi:snRNA-activating protein complex subunit 3